MVGQTEFGMIQVEQAIFASLDRGNVQGYHLVAKSVGIDSSTALELTRWAPTQLPSDAPENWTISSWPLDNGTVAVARTVYGGPEYSNRGGTQVVTLFLVLQQEQFDRYQCNQMTVVKTAMALGYLRLPLDMRYTLLPQVILPDRPIIEAADSIQDRKDRDANDRLIDEVAERINDSQRVAVVGLPNSVDAIETLISGLTIDRRKMFSFTTGLSPSIRRPVQAHFYQRPDVARQRALESQDIVCIHAMPGNRSLAQNH